MPCKLLLATIKLCLELIGIKFSYINQCLGTHKTKARLVISFHTFTRMNEFRQIIDNFETLNGFQGIDTAILFYKSVSTVHASIWWIQFSVAMCTAPQNKEDILIAQPPNCDKKWKINKACVSWINWSGKNFFFIFSSFFLHLFMIYWHKYDSKIWWYDLMVKIFF